MMRQFSTFMMSNLLISKNSLEGGTRGLVVSYCDIIKISGGVSEA